jgi:two-component system chemotaxis response regulator CheY
MNANAEIARIKLPPALDLTGAAGLLDSLRRGLDARSAVVIDAAEVETLTVPCVQIILAALKSCDRISIEQPSAAFVAAFEDLGIDFSQFCLAPAAAPDQPAAPPKPAGDADPAIMPDVQSCVPDMAAAGDAAPSIVPGQPAADADASGNTNSPTAPAEEQAMAKRILTIDDSKTIRDMLRFTLADAGFEVLQAVDGQDGLDVLGKEQVDVVITDINMPKMDGYEVIRRMRSDSAHKSTPILVLTTESEVDKRDIARQAGATGWMVKPFDPDRLIATINKVAS